MPFENGLGAPNQVLMMVTILVSATDNLVVQSSIWVLWWTQIEVSQAAPTFGHIG